MFVAYCFKCKRNEPHHFNFPCILENHAALIQWRVTINNTQSYSEQLYNHDSIFTSQIFCKLSTFHTALAPRKIWQVPSTFEMINLWIQKCENVIHYNQLKCLHNGSKGQILELGQWGLGFKKIKMTSVVSNLMKRLPRVEIYLGN